MAAEGGIRFYAGAPLKSPESFHLGTVCAIDSVPHQVSTKQLRMLRSLSSIIMDELEQREKIKSIVRLQTDLINMAVHDLRQPVTSSLLYLQVIKEQKDVSAILEMSEKVSALVQNIEHKLNGLLNISKIENGNLELNLEPCDVQEIIAQLIPHFDIRALQKSQHIKLVTACCSELLADKSRLVEFFENLLSNALKYSPSNTTLRIYITKEDGYILLNSVTRAWVLTART